MAFPVYSQVWPLGPAGPRARPVGFSRSPHLSTEGSRVCLGGPTQTPSPLGPPSAGVPAPPPPVVSKLDVLSRDFYFSRSVVSGGDSVFDSQWQAQVIYQEHTHTPFLCRELRVACGAWLQSSLGGFSTAVIAHCCFNHSSSRRDGSQDQVTRSEGCHQGAFLFLF